MASVKDLLLASLDRSRDLTLSMLKDVPADKLAAQLPGAVNHFLWTVGHQGTAYPFFGSAIGATVPPAPPEFDALFGMGSQPVGDATKYPPLADLVAYSNAAYAALRSHAAGLTDAALATPCGEKGGGFLHNYADAIVMLANHEGWHAGQLAALRKALGLKGIFG